MNRNKVVSVVLCIIGVIFPVISIVLAVLGVDVKIVCSGIFLTLCFVLLGMVFNKKDDNK